MSCNCTESKMCLACGPAKSAKHRPSDTGGEVWVDTRCVHLDETVMMGHGYDWEGWELCRLEMHSPRASFAIWPHQLGGRARWSLYCNIGGRLIFERFTDEAQAKVEAEMIDESLAALASKGDTGGDLSEAAFEDIFESWDGCMYDAPGENIDIDIGAALRIDIGKLLATAPRAAIPARDAALEEAAQAVVGMGSTDPIMSYGQLCAEAIRKLKGVAAIPAAGSSAWISVDDERKPEPRKPVLLFVRTLTRGENDDGKPFADEGEEVTMGEWRTCVPPLSDYFDCYTSPMSDNDWVTHWMPLPATPTATKDRA